MYKFHSHIQKKKKSSIAINFVQLFYITFFELSADLCNDF